MSFFFFISFYKSKKYILKQHRPFFFVGDKENQIKNNPIIIINQMDFGLASLLFFPQMLTK
jgi:hypothetical protein